MYTAKAQSNITELLPMTMEKQPASHNDHIEQLSINTIRTLSMDAVQKAESGHPGTPMALAPVGYTLWQHTLRYNPEQPLWPNRDRFVLSVGHASMLLYSLLHLSQIKAVDKAGNVIDKPAVSLDDIKNFRQLDSNCPGHPEFNYTTGVETTTGPLGQGVANSVGMAMAEAWLAEKYNRAEYKVFDHRVFALCGDGDLMEGISSEAASMAGHLKLNKLCWIYDNNSITIEGRTDLAFSENVKLRFESYGWHVHQVHDANDIQQLKNVLDKIAAATNPTLIIVDSKIGYGSPNKQDSASAHGEALGAEEIKLTKRFYNWPEDQSFYVPQEVIEHISQHFGQRGQQAYAQWSAMFNAYQQAHPQLAEEIKLLNTRGLPSNWDKTIPYFETSAKGVASRDSSGKVLNALAKQIPWLLGGAADLAPSTKTRLTFDEAGDFGAPVVSAASTQSSKNPLNYGGRNLHFGVREHAMGAIVNGLVLSGLRAFGSTFLIFSDYMRPAIRLAAVMEIPAVFVFSHDSIGVGEDGPTHQPIEQLASLRAIPGLFIMRPGDANETAEAWRFAMSQSHRPTCLVVSRQALPTIDRQRYASANGVNRGAYVVADSHGFEGKDGETPVPTQLPQVILLATGSELGLCMDAYEKLHAAGVVTRVVSMPSWELFEEQTRAYRDCVIPPTVMARVAVERAASLGWDRYVGASGMCIAMRTFGASAPLSTLSEHFGFSVEKIVQAAYEQIAQAKQH